MHLNLHRTCFRAVAQIPFEQLVAHRKKLESLNERVGVDGGELMEVNENSDGKTPSASALASSRLTLAFSLVIITLEHGTQDTGHRDIHKTHRWDIGRSQ